MTIDIIAQTAHEVNRAYCQAIGDDSQLPWNEAPQWQKDSAIKGVQFHLENPNATPENSHESWLKEKAMNNWSYGEVKDEKKKTHPCFRPYNELPQEQRVKDYLFRQVIHSLSPLLVVDIPAELTQYPLTEEEATPAVTPGMKAIDVAFNSGREDIVNLKLKFAAAWDGIDDAVKAKMRAEYNTGSPNETQKEAMGNINRLAAVAKTQLELGSMAAVKAITR